MPLITLPGATRKKSLSQCQHPRGWIGRLVLWSMNRRHAPLTDWGLSHVAAAQRTNQGLVKLRRVIIQQASASDLPYPDSTFDLVTAVETHFWWSDLAAGMREAIRVLKPGGHMAVIAEFYNGGKHAK